MKDYDDPVYIDVERIEESIDSGEIVLPKGLTGEERRVWIRKYLHLNYGEDSKLKEQHNSLICDCPKNYGRACKKPDKYKTGVCK